MTMQIQNKVRFGDRTGSDALFQARQICVTLILCGITILSYFTAGGHDSQRILQVAFFLAFGVVILLSRHVTILPTQNGDHRLSFCLLAFFLLGILSSLHAYSPRHAFYEVASLLFLLLVGTRVGGEMAGDYRKRLNLVLTALGFGCTLYAFEILVIYPLILSGGSWPDPDTFAPGFSYIRFLNHAQTIALPMLALLYALSKSGTKARWLWLSVTAFWWTLLFVTGGRGTIVGLLAACGAVLVLRRAHARAFLAAMGWTAFVGLAIYAVMFTLVPLAFGMERWGGLAQIAERTAADPTSSRLAIWAHAIELIVANPWLGVGPLHYAHSSTAIQNGAHPHNWLLQIGAEWGVPALLCLCGAVGLAMRRLLRTAKLIPAGDANGHTMLAAWIAIGVAILVDGLVSGLIVMPASQLLIALYLGCAAGWCMSFNPAGTPQPNAGSAWSGALAACVVVAAMLAVANGVWPEIGARARQEPPTAHEAAVNHGISWPRLWLNGFF